ncbi:MAG: MOSC domain-containing protein [Nocardioidaceae bacterium]
MSALAYVRSVNVGHTVDADWAGRLRRTAIDKRPVAGRTAVDTLGLVEDEQADRANHGGPDQSVYAFAREDLDRWQRALGRPLADGQFGENLTTVGMDVNESLIGERWRIGTVLLEVCSVRIPCRVFAAWLTEHRWVRRFTAEGRPGPYLRVLEEGALAAGDPIEVVHRPAHAVTVSCAFQALTTRPELLPLLLEAPALVAEARDKAREYALKPTVG